MAATTAATSDKRPVNGLSGRLAAARHDLDRALVVARREVIDMLRDWRIIAPIVILTVIFPSIANWGAGRMVGWVQQYGADLVGERLIPFLMMVVGFFPISFSLIIALESFVGEKERHSLEPLLASPLSNLQLYIGKTLSSTVPPFIGSLLGITVYLVGVYFNVGWTPPPVLLAQVVLLSIAHALVMVSGAVIISSQVTSVRAANLLSSFIIIPMAFLIQGEALIMFWAQYGVLWWILAGLLMVNAVLVRMGTRIFNREQLLGKEIDDLNLFSGIRSWWRLTLARREGSPRRSPWTWYRQEVLGQLPRLLPALALLAAAVVVGYFIGREYADVYRIPPDVFVVDNWYERFSEVLIQSGLVGIGGVWRVIFQNIRVLIVASLLGMFTFGVLTVLVLMIPFALVGYLIAQMTVAGLDPVMLWAALIPHSMLEVPAALLAGAAAIRLGASVIAPPPGKTLGEGWLSTLADATRLWGALILPLLILAAVVEVFVTPTIILMMGR